MKGVLPCMHGQGIRVGASRDGSIGSAGTMRRKAKYLRETLHETEQRCSTKSFSRIQNC